MTRTLLVILCALMLSSCSAHTANDRLILGGRYPTGSFGGGGSVIQEPQARRPRARWAGVVVVVPTDGTITGQTLRTPKYLRPTDPARLYGRFPTINDALDAQEQGWLRDGWWAFDELGRAFGEIALMPVRAAVYSITEPRTWSPERAWKRRPADDAWSSGQPRAPRRASDDDANE